MSSEVIIVPREVSRRAESLISSGNVTKGVELLLVENLYSSTAAAAGPNQVDSSAIYKRGMKILQDTPFEALGVDLGCQTIDVRKAYKKLALKYHPDKNPKTTPLFQVIQSACSKLSAADDREKEEQQANAKKRAANIPTPSSFAPPKPAAAAGGFPSAYGNNPKPQPSAQPQPQPQPTPRASGPDNRYAYPNAASYGGAYGSAANGSYQYGANNGGGGGSYNYGAGANPQSGKPNAYFNSNNPYAQANAQRQANNVNSNNQQNNQNPYSQYSNPKNDEAKRKNYYEELLKEQYKKAAEADQRAREFAAKRTTEQKSEFESHMKRAQQQYQQYQQYQQNSKATDPPLNSFRPTAANNINSNASKAQPSASSYQPNSYVPEPSNASANQNLPQGVGRTYKATSDGRVYPQQQFSPRPGDPSTQPTNPPTSNQPKYQSEPTKQPSFSKKVVPKPFSLKINSCSATIVELEWKTSVLHHCNLGVELSWKEKTSPTWEVSEKMIRSGCCRKKNLNAGCTYEFRVRAVEDFPNNVPGNKSEWSDIVSGALPPLSEPKKSGKANGVPQQQPLNPKNVSQQPPLNSGKPTEPEVAPRFPDKEKRSPPPTEFPKPTQSNSVEQTAGNANAAEKKYQPAAPTKLDSIPQKFRRFNSKMKAGHQMESTAETRSENVDSENVPKNQFSASKVLSASAREAWGRETERLGQEKEKQEREREREREKEKGREKKNRKDLDNLGDDVRYVEVEGEGEIDEEEEEEVLIESKDQDEWDEITEDEEVVSAEKAKKVNHRKTNAAAASDSDSVNTFEKKIKHLDREYDKQKKRTGKVSNDKSPFDATSDYEQDDGFAEEEEIHYKLVPPADASSTNLRKKAGKSKKNMMEVVDHSGVSVYLHPVHSEPFSRADVKGYVSADKVVIGCASCGDWVRVKIHVIKEATNIKKSISPAKDGSTDLWGWCLLKDKDHCYLRESSGNNSHSGVSALPSIKKSPSQASDKESTQFRTPLKKKSLASKNSLGNTSLFNLNKPTPKTAQKSRKKHGDVEHIDLEDSYDEEAVPQWMECHDDQGNIYYYNDKTNQSSWDAPEWIEEIDPGSGAKYYCHFVYNGEEVSMTSTWTRPRQFARVIRHVTDL